MSSSGLEPYLLLVLLSEISACATCCAMTPPSVLRPALWLLALALGILPQSLQCSAPCFCRSSLFLVLRRGDCRSPFRVCRSSLAAEACRSPQWRLPLPVRRSLQRLPHRRLAILRCRSPQWRLPYRSLAISRRCHELCLATSPPPVAAAYSR